MSDTLRRHIADTQHMEAFAREVLEHVASSHKKSAAYLLTLSGELGAGKTTLTQEMAKLLRISESVQSPTFVLLRTYGMTGHPQFSRLAHIDAYRLSSPTELGPLGWSDLVKDPHTLIVLEWPEHVSPLTPSVDATITLVVHPKGGREATLNIA